MHVLDYMDEFGNTSKTYEIAGDYILTYEEVLEQKESKLKDSENTT